MSDPINPDYYKRDGIECIEAIEAAVQPITDPSIAFAVGSTIKYMWRAFEKHQSPVPCLLKARWYLDRALRLAGHQDNDGTALPETPPAPATTPAGLDLSRVVAAWLDVDRLYLAECRPEGGYRPITAIYLRTLDGRTIDAREAVALTPPPAPAIPELPAGTTPTVPGAYWMHHIDSTGEPMAWYLGDAAIRDFRDKGREWRFAGPIPLPSFAREGREGGVET
jgi:hypothetical protein